MKPVFYAYVLFREFKNEISFQPRPISKDVSIYIGHPLYNGKRQMEKYFQPAKV